MTTIDLTGHDNATVALALALAAWTVTVGTAQPSELRSARHGIYAALNGQPPSTATQLAIDILDQAISGTESTT